MVQGTWVGVPLLALSLSFCFLFSMSAPVARVGVGGFVLCPFLPFFFLFAILASFLGVDVRRRRTNAIMYLPNKLK